jgi:biopolymer transport protein ExbD
MTSLVDVIFLLLLFFMLSSTFGKFGEVELASAGAGAGPAADSPPLFVLLEPERLRLNGREIALDSLAGELARLRDAGGDGDSPLAVLIALRGPVSAQGLTDLLAVLRGIAGLRATVLEGA